MVISVPAISMGLKSEFSVVPKVVFPAKVTVDPVLSLVRRIVELAGAEMFSRTMLVHAATTDVICAYSDAVQEAGADATAIAVLVTWINVDDAFAVVALELVVLETAAVDVATSPAEEEVGSATEEEMTASEEDFTAVFRVVAKLRQLHALLNFLGLEEHAVAKDGRPVVAADKAVVYVAQNAAADPEEAVKAYAHASLSELSQARMAGTSSAASEKSVGRIFVMPSIQGKNGCDEGFQAVYFYKEWNIEGEE